MAYTINNETGQLEPSFLNCGDGEEPDPVLMSTCVPCDDGYAGMGGICKQCGENETFFRVTYAEEFGSRFQSQTCPEDVPWYKTGPFILSMLALTFVGVGFGAVVGLVKGGKLNECNKKDGGGEDSALGDVDLGAEVTEYKKTGKLVV
jgi:hypothetical protein